MSKKRALKIIIPVLAAIIPLAVAFVPQFASAAPNIAEGSILSESDFPTGSETSGWQIVDGGYTGNYDPVTLNAAGEDVSDPPIYKTAVSDDGLVRVQKNVIPTGVENEFLVYLSMDTKTTRTVTITQINNYLANRIHYWNPPGGSGTGGVQ